MRAKINDAVLSATAGWTPAAGGRWSQISRWLLEPIASGMDWKMLRGVKRLAETSV